MFFVFCVYKEKCTACYAFKALIRRGGNLQMMTFDDKGKGGKNKIMLFDDEGVGGSGVAGLTFYCRRSYSS